MDSPYYSTAELVEVIRTIRTPRRFFLDRFFRATPYLSTREEIVFDEVLEDLPVMAPFVSPVVQAKPQKRRGFQAKSFVPAYVKPKHFIKPGDFIRRNPGEALLGSLDQASRYDAARLDTLALQKRQIEERWEWMAAKAVVDGKVTVKGEDYPEREVDFGRSGDNEIVVTGAGNLWSNAAADIGGMLEDWSDVILGKTGYAGTDVIMAPEVWKYLRQNTQLLKEADLRRGVQNTPNLQPQAAVEGARLVGQWGEFTLWVYAGRFKEQDGTLSRALAATDIVMTAAPSQEDGTGGVHGIRCFGAIQDKGAMMQPLDIFPKSWEEDDPSGEQLMSQSAPLMVPGRPNATLKAQVV
ncbi:major capsid protein [Aurantimonas sp. 22II-16-19i]|uniref:major capsid protein n=1 Tax=Aurantimonas sp. 22II-16-19i TaxID=1317114 RepID=UPI0009F7B48A|nr:major capsid protein [Aurantimonas sp. 22II-16-19i]ORE89751.1 putative Major head protein (gpE) (Major coat protein) [Aurantimonas sp. 22II-16-19i]